MNRSGNKKSVEKAIAAIELFGNPTDDFVRRGMDIAGTTGEVIDMSTGLIIIGDVMVETIANLTGKTKQQVIDVLRSEVDRL